MCDFCHKHGEGKKWYLEAKNYSDDLLNDLRRRNFIKKFFLHPERQKEGIKSLDRLDRAPGFVRRVLTTNLVKRQQRVHFGQVVPIEEVEQILDFVTSAVRVACICRQVNLGTEQRYCYGLSLAPNGGELAKLIREIDAAYLTGPHTKGLEMLSKEETLAAMRGYEHEGLCHTVWTFIAPFIGGVCNCDRADCLAMQATVTHQFPVMFRAEYVGQASPDLCNGCRQCMRVCQFGAIGYSAATQKIEIDPRRCYGCGVCRTVCRPNAIRLLNRGAVSLVANLW
ncbi:MAG: 4Fe-4S binding protein [Candidatus Aminicenantales bacterium]